MLPVLGVTKIRKEDYETMRKILVNPNEMDDTWEEWRAATQKFKDNMRKKGFKVVDVLVLPQDFILYCRENGLHLTKSSRAQYVQHKVARMGI